MTDQELKTFKEKDCLIINERVESKKKLDQICHNLKKLPGLQDKSCTTKIILVPHYLIN